MKVSQAEWEAKGRELFGEDKCNWRFVCPKCGDECSLNEVKERYSELKGCGWQSGRDGIRSGRWWSPTCTRECTARE